jgi:glyoxylase-like metal-dependent hydrolase (beta-lactamase superfamily II)
MCPYGGRFVSGSRAEPAELVVHALLLETNAGLVLVDTGFGLEDVADARRRLGAALVWSGRLALRDEDTAAVQVTNLGFRREDVRDVVVTHLDPDHAGGLPDFPHARVHVHRREQEAALARATVAERRRYRPPHFAHGPRWVLHEESGETWNGFACVRAIADDVLLVPLHGHTRGHAGVAVRAGGGEGPEWLLHAGDAYFFHEEIASPPRCPVGLALFQRAVAIDDRARRENQRRLRDLHRDQGARVRIFSAHSPHELRALAGVTSSRS